MRTHSFVSVPESEVHHQRNDWGLEFGSKVETLENENFVRGQEKKSTLREV